MKKVFITGTAGFIGFHLARQLLAAGYEVRGFDAMTDYYDVGLKEKRHAMLDEFPAFTRRIAYLEDMAQLQDAIGDFQPDIIVHLAAQAGVRYSLENPRAYVESNIVGTFNLLECAREFGVQHLLMASTSSVYGANRAMPFVETERTAHPLTLYAASKSANEAMAHSYSHLWKIPTTMFRFFTVYGPWGRPDLALFKFVRAALAGEPIDVYNHGEMARDFTYVDDLVDSVVALMDCIPGDGPSGDLQSSEDSLSPAAPYRIVNIGNSSPVRLLDFIDEIERCIGRPIARNYMEMQKGDVPETWADTTLLQSLTGKVPSTDIARGIAAFVDWYRDYYKV